MTVALLASLPASYDFKLPHFGTGDFIEYWSAWQLMLQGDNPYDYTLMHSLQLSEGQAANRTVMMWNPPWTATLLAPLLALPFSAAAMIWLVLQVLLLALVALLMPRVFGGVDQPLILKWCATTVFIPVFSALDLGQLGVLFLTSIVCFLLLEKERRFALCGAVLIPLLCKPHLFFLFAVPGVVWLRRLSRDERQRFLCGLSAGFAALVVLTLLVSPNSLAYWFAAMEMRDSADATIGAYPTVAWRTLTVTTFARDAMQSLTGTRPLWPMWAVPAVAFAATSAFFITRRQRSFSWTEVTPPLLCLSLLFGSYGWFCDHAVLAVCQASVVLGSARYVRPWTRRLMWILVATIQVVALVNYGFVGATADRLVWFPFAMLLIMHVGRGLERVVESTPEDCRQCLN